MKVWKFALILALIFCLTGAAASAGEPLCVSLNGEAFLIGEDGSVLIPAGTFAAIMPLSISENKTLYAVSLPDSGLFALADDAGNMLSEAIYDYIYAQDGVLFCLQGDAYGALHENGSLQIPCEYSFLTANGTGGFLALRSDPYDDIADGLYVIDETGESTATGVKVLHLYTGMQEGLLPAVSPENNLYGYLGADGHWAIPPQYDYADIFIDGCAQASISTGCGIISRDGKWLLSPKYEFVDTADGIGHYRLAYTRAGVALIEKDTWQTAAEYENASGQAMEGGYLAVFTPEETIFFGPDGGERFRLTGDLLFWDMHSDGAVIQTGEWGEACFHLYDLSGSRVSDGYQMLGRLCDGLYQTGRFEVKKTEYDGGELVLNEEMPNTMRFGCIDSQGREILPMEYTTLYALSGDRLWLEKDGKGYLADKNGQIIAEYAAGEGKP